MIVPIVTDTGYCIVFFMASIFTMFFLFYFFILVIRNTGIDISSLYYNVPNYTPSWFFIFRLMFRMCNGNIETLDPVNRCSKYQENWQEYEKTWAGESLK